MKEKVPQEWTTHIKAKTKWYEIDLLELLKYKDLINLFVMRNYKTRYKQTVLGPMWLVLNPLITVLLYTLVFGSLAGMSTDGSPQFLFYLASNALWSYFALCLQQTSTTFSANAAVFGKVYFPRLVTPISTVLTALLDLLIQVVMLVIIIGIYWVRGTKGLITPWILLIPILILQMALLGLGCGIIISALTTKYRDLGIVVGFGIQIWQYLSPVVYSASQIPEQYRTIYFLNPIAPIITIWRYAFLGTGTLPLGMWGISWIVTIIVLSIGVILFSHVEKTFMDTV